MVPRRRITDSGDGESMERAFALLRDEMRVGFEGLNKRLDVMNGRVNTHGEELATLRGVVKTNEELSHDLRELAETFATHRARCPYDGGLSAGEQPVSRWSNSQMAWGVGGGSVGGFVLMELVRWWLDHVKGGG